MADMTLKPYTESGSLVNNTPRYLDILQDAKPKDSPEIKTMTPLYRDYSYSIFLRKPGTLWDFTGVQNTNHGINDLDYLRSNMRYLYKVVAVASTLPSDVRALNGKYLRIEGIVVNRHVKQDIRPWAMTVREVRTL